MSETLTMEPAEIPAGELNAPEMDALRIGNEMEAEQEQLLAGKYKNAEDLENAYIELQKKLGEKSEPDSTPEVTNEEPTEEPTEESTEEPKEEVEENILDTLWDQATANNVSQDTIDKINGMKSEDVAKLALQYRQKVQANAPRDLSEKEVTQLKGVVGGEQNYNNMLQWANQNLQKQEVDMYDKVMDQGNPLACYFAVQALAYRYQDSTGKDGQMLTGKPPKQTQDVYQSQAEMVRDMEDSRYDDDPAYRQKVMNKIERSNINF